MPPHTSSPVTASLPAEPRAEQRPLERTLHDVRLVDEYAWLKAENWREVMRDPFQLDPASTPTTSRTASADFSSSESSSSESSSSTISSTPFAPIFTGTPM